MKKLFESLLALVLILFLNGLKAQDCRFYFPTDEGSVTEMANYDEKDKLQGSVKYTITGKETSGSKVTVGVNFESFDDKGKEAGSGDLEVRCENGVFYMDMKNFLSSQMMEGYEGTDMKIEATDMGYPSDLDVGKTLSDASIKITTEGAPMMSMATTVNITNRKVEAKESVTVPAGTFECYKISYDLNTKMMMMKVESKAVEWIAEGVGAVRTESYNKKGKLIGYTVLTAFNK